MAMCSMRHSSDCRMRPRRGGSGSTRSSAGSSASPEMPREAAGVARVWRGFVIVLSLTLVVGCSGGIRNRGDEASPVAGATPTTERPPSMPILTPTPVAPPAQTTGPTTVAPAENPATYVVIDGDSLYAIALRFGVDLNMLIELNGLRDPNDISVGQELKIPPKP
ncbi:MAG TPA: hypothetical protein DEG70_07350 [Chloroflexi bacterium]|nr:hypothetical protein [Chloroflexota bacterium]